MPDKLDYHLSTGVAAPKEARTIGEQMKDQFTRETMFNIAREYEEPAERAETRVRSS